MFPETFATASLLRPAESHQAAERSHYLPAQCLMVPTRTSSLHSPLSNAPAHHGKGRADVSGSGCRRAVLIFIQYKGQEYGGQDFELPASHSALKDIKELLICRLFQCPRFLQVINLASALSYKDEDIVILMDDGYHTSPTQANIVCLCSESAPCIGDSLLSLR